MTLSGQAKRDYQNKWLQERRKAWIDSRGGKCEKCGSQESLEVDHIDPKTKLMNPRSIWSRNKEIRDAELAKCQVLCSECHIEKSKLDAFVPIEHGTYKGSRRCNCQECRKTIAPYWREYRKNKQSRLA